MLNLFICLLFFIGLCLPSTQVMAVIYQPVHKTFKTFAIKKSAYQGQACYFDLRQQNDPNYRPPMGEFHFTLYPQHMMLHSSVGGLFNGCQLATEFAIAQDIRLDLTKYQRFAGFITCVQTGCSDDELNRTTHVEYPVQGGMRQETRFFSFDPSTRLLVQRNHASTTINNQDIQDEMLYFTFESTVNDGIDYSGIWQQTEYLKDDIQEFCLYINQTTVLRLKKIKPQCPTGKSYYFLWAQDVSKQFQDMWWLNPYNRPATLAQMNVMVRFPETQALQYTTWEYTPAGDNWDQGALYRYQQSIVDEANGRDQINTHVISEFKKIKI